MKTKLTLLQLVKATRQLMMLKKILFHIVEEEKEEDKKEDKKEETDVPEEATEVLDKK